MPSFRPLKAFFAGGSVSSLGEVADGESLPIELGGTGATTLAGAQAALGITALGFTPENAANKGAANGYAPLGADSKVAATYLPSYVDDVLEFANFAALPATGESGKIYVLAAPYTNAGITSSQFRWSGSAYAPIIASPGSTDAVTEGASNLYFTYQRVRDAVLTGLSTATSAVVTAADSVLQAIGKLQAQINAIQAALPGAGAYAPGHIYGLAISNNATDPTNDIDVSAGSARDAANTADINLATALTKRLDATWAAGTGSGGLDAGAVADGTYHVFLIKRADTGVVDVLFSTSPSAPTLPANYGYKRRIGSILREGGTIVLFDQYGDTFKRKTQAYVRDSTAVVTDILLAMKVPEGIKTAPLFITDCQLSSAGSLIQLMSDGNMAVANESVNRSAGTEYSVNVVTGHFITNTAGQLRFSLINPAGTASFARIQTQGWIDGRGR